MALRDQWHAGSLMTYQISHRSLYYNNRDDNDRSAVHFISEVMALLLNERTWSMKLLQRRRFIKYGNYYI